ncbi:hypothetical protein BKA81DRAFT_55247 [Phyllosticta paracitricarpa]|uniref:Uncharacterized protein n=1 Tax=Phyllosticta paracitricarpa TaxID=2016321 RepID=A0ABR1NEZ5_9PEZI
MRPPPAVPDSPGSCGWKAGCKRLSTSLRTWLARFVLTLPRATKVFNLSCWLAIVLSVPTARCIVAADMASEPLYPASGSTNVWPSETSIRTISSHLLPFWPVCSSVCATSQKVNLSFISVPFICLHPSAPVSNWLARLRQTPSSHSFRLTAHRLRRGPARFTSSC